MIQASMLDAMQTLFENLPIRNQWYIEALVKPEQFQLELDASSKIVLHRSFFHPQYLETAHDGYREGFHIPILWADSLVESGVPIAR